jgi:hypothetical protein
LGHLDSTGRHGFKETILRFREAKSEGLVVALIMKSEMKELLPAGLDCEGTTTGAADDGMSGTGVGVGGTTTGSGVVEGITDP